MEPDYSPKFIKLNEESEINQILKNMKSQVLEVMKMTRNETLDKAAEEFANVRYNPYVSPTGNMIAKNIACKVGFRQGVEWQRNNIWHKTDEPPEQGRPMLIRLKSGEFDLLDDCKKASHDFMMSHVDLWAYINDILPVSFDEILAQNKDVLQRLKE